MRIYIFSPSPIYTHIYTHTHLYAHSDTDAHKFTARHIGERVCTRASKYIGNSREIFHLSLEFPIILFHIKCKVLNETMLKFIQGRIFVNNNVERNREMILCHP